VVWSGYHTRYFAKQLMKKTEVVHDLKTLGLNEDVEFGAKCLTLWNFNFSLLLADVHCTIHATSPVVSDVELVKAVYTEKDTYRVFEVPKLSLRPTDPSA